MIIQSLILHGSNVGTESRQMLWKSRAATTDSTPTNEAYFSAQFARARPIDGLRRGIIDLLPNSGLGEHIEDKPHNDGINEEEPISINGSTNESGYSEPTHDDVNCLISEALEE